MTTHLWNFNPGQASLCGKALYTHRLTADPGKVTCATCYLNWLRAGVERAYVSAVNPGSGRESRAE